MLVRHSKSYEFRKRWYLTLSQNGSDLVEQAVGNKKAGLRLEIVKITDV